MAETVVFAVFHGAVFLAFAWFLARTHIRCLAWRRTLGTAEDFLRDRHNWPHLAVLYGVLAALTFQTTAYPAFLKGFRSLVSVAALLALYYLVFINNRSRLRILFFIHREARRPHPPKTSK